MNQNLKKISKVTLFLGLSYLLYVGFKKYILKSKKENNLEDSKINLLETPNSPYSALQEEILNAYKDELNQKIGDDIISNIELKKQNNKNIKQIKQIKKGIIYKENFLRVSKHNGNLIIGKIKGNYNIYEVFATIYSPIKLIELYKGVLTIKDIKINQDKKEESDDIIKIIDNTNKQFFLNEDTLNNIFEKFSKQKKIIKFSSDKADFTLIRK